MKFDRSAGQNIFIFIFTAVILIFHSGLYAQFSTNSSMNVSDKSDKEQVLSEEEQETLLGFRGDTSSGKLQDFPAASEAGPDVASSTSETKPTKPIYVPPLGSSSLGEAAAKENTSIGKRSGVPGTAPDGSFLPSGSDGKSKADTPSQPSLWRSFFSLLAVVAVIIVLAYFAKKLFPGQVNLSMGKVVQVIGRTPIDSKRSLTLVKFGNDLLLLATGGENVSLVDKVSDPERVATLMGSIEAERVNSISKSFSSVFTKERGDYGIEGDLEDEEIIEEYQDDAMSEADKELSGLLNKVKGLSRINPKR